MAYNYTSYTIYVRIWQDCIISHVQEVYSAFYISKYKKSAAMVIYLKQITYSLASKVVLWYVYTYNEQTFH